MSVDISGFEDVSKERKSKVWVNMLFHKQKGLALCKICLGKQFTRIVYAKNGSTNLSNTYIFEYRSTFYNNTVWVLPLGAQILGTQSSRVPVGNTQKNPKF